MPRDTDPRQSQGRPPAYDIPAANLPDGFAESIAEEPAEPVEPRPAATIVLLRDGPDGPEALLVRRTRASGFVPGAWVFPGGRVDESDRDAALAERVSGLTPTQAAARLGLEDAPSAALGYYLAAVREAFEETGLLIGLGSTGARVPDAARDPVVDHARATLLEDRVRFLDLLIERDWRLDGAGIAYLAHWITPVVEPRRYDTRFFLAGVPADSHARLDPREMIAERWVRPAEALEENAAGRLPMVFPTIHTLEGLTTASSVEGGLSRAQAADVPTILPRLVRTPTGVGLEIPEDGVPR